jgi:Flp pilus assembly CpaE family ATPase
LNPAKSTARATTCGSSTQRILMSCKSASRPRFGQRHGTALRRFGVAFYQALGGAQTAFLALHALNRLAHQLLHHGTFVLIGQDFIE